MENEFQIGSIINAHGIKGEVKVYPTTDDPQKFKKLKSVIMRPERGEVRVMDIEGAKFFKNLVILKLKGINTMDDAQKLHHATLWVSREDAVPLGKDEYYRADLYGMQVLTDEGSVLGELTDIFETGANDVYEVTMQDGKKALLPAIKECILAVDVTNAKMTVHVMDGLLD